MNSKQNNLRFEEEFTLDLNELHELDDDSEIQFDLNYKPDENDEDFKSQESDDADSDDGYTFDTKKEIIAFRRSCKTKRKRKFSKVQNEYKRVKSEYQLDHWERMIKKHPHGTVKDIYKYINHYVYEKFYRSRKIDLNFVHDYNSKLWGMEAAHQKEFTTFKASDSWLYNFKV